MLLRRTVTTTSTSDGGITLTPTDRLRHLGPHFTGRSPQPSPDQIATARAAIGSLNDEELGARYLMACPVIGYFLLRDEDIRSRLTGHSDCEVSRVARGAITRHTQTYGTMPTDMSAAHLTAVPLRAPVHSWRASTV